MLSGKSLRRQCQKGMATIMLIMFTALAVFGFLYAVIDKNQFFLKDLVSVREEMQSRSILSICADVFINRLMADNRYTPSSANSLQIFQYINALFDKNDKNNKSSQISNISMQCRLTSFSSQVCRGIGCCSGARFDPKYFSFASVLNPTCTTSSYGEIKTFDIQASSTRSGDFGTASVGEIETLEEKVLFMNASPFVPFVIYKKQI